MSDGKYQPESVPEHLNDESLNSNDNQNITPIDTEIEKILGENHLVKKELALELRNAGLSMESIGRILNLRVKIIRNSEE